MLLGLFVVMCAHNIIPVDYVCTRHHTSWLCVHATLYQLVVCARDIIPVGYVCTHYHASWLCACVIRAYRPVYVYDIKCDAIPAIVHTTLLQIMT